MSEGLEVLPLTIPGVEICVFFTTVSSYYGSFCYEKTGSEILKPVVVLPVVLFAAECLLRQIHNGHALLTCATLNAFVNVDRPLVLISDLIDIAFVVDFCCVVAAPTRLQFGFTVEVVTLSDVFFFLSSGFKYRVVSNLCIPKHSHGYSELRDEVTVWKQTHCTVYRKSRPPVGYFYVSTLGIQSIFYQ